MNKIEKKKTIYLKITCISFVLMEIYVGLPIVTAYFSGIVFKAVFTIVSLVALLSAATYSKQWFKIFYKNILIFLMFYILIILVNYLFNRYSVENDLLSCIDICLLYIFMSLGYFFMIVKNKNVNRIVIGVFLICLIITLLTTIRGLAINSNYSRMLSSNATSSDTMDFLRKLNIRSL